MTRPQPHRCSIAGWLPLLLVLLTIPGARAAETSCRAEIGPARSAVLVDRCTDVSPATHPPCNAANPCSLIREEIARGCAFLTKGGGKGPAYCREGQ